MIITIESLQINKLIINILISKNPGYDFGVNPKDISDIIKDKHDIDITPIQIGHILKRLGFTQKLRTSKKVYRKITIDKLNDIKKELDREKEFKENN